MSDPAFIALLQTIVAGDTAAVLERLQDLQLVLAKATETHFFDDIKHYIYAGDTALHMAAAAFRSDIAQALIDRGADLAARNRRGAQPLHYAADAHHWDPDAQAATISCLIAAGADPNATDKSGVAPLHRAVRTRCAAAVEALLAGGADPLRKNGNGSTPLHLAMHNTGKGGSGTERAHDQQRRIVALLDL